jgi:ribosomal protein S16
MTGKVSLDAVSVNVPESALAEHGWFFLQGMIAFTKFKGVDLNRRQTPGAVDDLRIATTFLRLQLQFTPDHWNAWFRLAECFDYELEEAVLWTAEKMNKDNREELIRYQRGSIHCYTLALSYSRSWVEDSQAAISSEVEDQVLGEMYYGFGMRLYASSREPFAMEPFQHADQERFFITPLGQADAGGGPGTFRKILHKEMTDYKVWKFASSLFRRAMATKPRDWKTPYMYAKCLWKMFQKPVEQLDHKDRDSKPTVNDVIAALERTVEVVVAQQKPRQDPILEPHYKILSVIHKLVMRGHLDRREAYTILQRQPFAPKLSDEINIEDMDDWEAYVLRSLRVLRDKDKSNWQHRLVMRHATILFDYEPSNSSEGDRPMTEAEHEEDQKNLVPAKAAFSVLRENMFTKTMVMNVWKCEAERPGRHHVYMSKYVRYVFRLLSVMNDGTNIEALLRRLRKKAGEFYRFNDLWTHCVITYMRVLRNTYSVPTDMDAVRNMSPDEFEIVADRIKEWVTEPAAQSHRALTALKEAIELKKLNSGLFKSPLFDDLITDCYSFLYTEIKASLPGEDPANIIEDRQKARDAELMEKLGQVKPTLLTDLLRPSEPDKDNTPLGSVRASAEPSEKHEGAPRRRTATVRKPDIIRKAEQVVLRAEEGPQPKTAGNGQGTKSRRGSQNITPAEELHDTSTDEDEDDGGVSTAEGRVADEDVEMIDADISVTRDAKEKSEDGQEAASSSPPGSVHDSADDESDLSDVPADYEDDAPPELLYPGLGTGVTGSHGRDEDGEDESSVGDEEDETGDEEEVREDGDQREHAEDEAMPDVQG